MFEIDTLLVTFAQYSAIFGVPVTERPWAGQLPGHCARMSLFYATAGFVDSLDILPARLAKDIQISSDILVMAAQLSKEAAAALLAREAARQSPVQITQQLIEYPRVIEVKDWLITQKTPPSDAVTATFVDEAFLNRTQWSLKRVLAPKHSIHM